MTYRQFNKQVKKWDDEKKQTKLKRFTGKARGPR